MTMLIQTAHAYHTSLMALIHACRYDSKQALCCWQVRLAEHRTEAARKEAQALRKDQLRPMIKHNILLKVGRTKTLSGTLRALGILIEGGMLANDKQIDKAYKKAAVLFHPDKHVNADLAKQVEAEETFKIISAAAARPKGKFS